ncbi:MAG: o-succinylbenzoate synthase [Actinomycetes bacterium]
MLSDLRLARVLADATPFALPLAVRFRGVEVREGVLLRGPSGWGEFAPFPEYDDVTASRWLACAVEAAYGQWPTARRSSVPVNAIVPAVPAQQAAALTYRAWVSDGCSTIKVKVAEKGQTLDDDIDRVSAVRAALSAASAYEPRIRIDANGAWSVHAAVSAIRELDQAAGGLEYVDQPCATMTELAAVRARVSVPVAADESIRTAADPILAARTGAADIVVIKVAPLCGVTLALEVAAAAGVPVVVSGAMDSSVGLAGGLAAAAALERLPYACGLGTGALFAEDLIAEPLRPRGGTLPVVRTEPDPAALERAIARVAPARRDWWLARLERAWFAGADVLVGALVS